VSETEPLDPVASPPPPAAPAPLPAARSGSRRGGLLLLVLVVFALAAALAWRQWDRLQDSERRAEAWETAASRLESRIGELEAALEATRRTQRTIETRASDNAATNKVLREELLGMGERASLLEDAVARLAENRLQGEMILRLNEAEFLLLMGEERLRLFGDVEAAMQAYALADVALAGVEDPVLATLRQTLAQELLALREVPGDVRPAIRAELARLAETLDGLAPSRAGEVAAVDANDSRLVRLLSQLVTVRRIDPQATVLGPAQREAALAALRLQLEQAQAALARPDAAAFTHALDQAGASIARLFDAADAGVVRVQAVLARLRETRLAPELPVLGATLRELRGLRAMRSASGLPRDAIVPQPVDEAPPAAVPPEAPAPGTGDGE
jgi:uroporphyrin-3 C-methyltransferase